MRKDGKTGYQALKDSLTKKNNLLKTQGYYYLVTTIWTTNPDKIFINEYGNKAAAEKAAKHWNSMPDCKAEIKIITSDEDEIHPFDKRN